MSSLLLRSTRRPGLRSLHPSLLSPSSPSSSSSSLLLSSSPLHSSSFHSNRFYSTDAPPKSPPRLNEVGIQMLSENLRQQIFGPIQKHQIPSAKGVEAVKKELLRFGLKPESVEVEVEDEVDFRLPGLLGGNVLEHFRRIGNLLGEPYVNQAQTIAKINLPEKPKKWSQTAGWTRYDSKKKTMEKVPHPLLEEGAVVFDVEVAVQEGHFPTLAVAATKAAWYSWVSPKLLNPKSNADELISFGEATKERLIIGHNVSYDRIRIKEEYKLKGNKNRFLDTMSLHMCVAGFNTTQRGLWKKRSNEEAAASLELEQQESSEEIPEASEALEAEKDGDLESFLDVGSLNSLKDVYEFHVNRHRKPEDQIVVSKELRNFFVDGTLPEILENFQDLMGYCANDVLYTHEIHQVLFPQFQQKCPHPVTFVGMLEMGSCYLPTSTNWPQFIANSEKAYDHSMKRIDELLIHLAQQAVKEGPEAAKKDPWLKQLDWTIEEQRFTKPRYKKDGSYAKGGEPRKMKQKMPGIPEWYKDLCDSDENVEISTRTRVTPYLLKLQWNGHPIFHLQEPMSAALTSNKFKKASKTVGWCYAVPHLPENASLPLFVKTIQNEDGTESDVLRIPHKSGATSSCGNPLSKDFLDSIEKNLLTSIYPEAKEVLSLNSTGTYWLSCRKRVLSQFVVWNDNGLIGNFKNETEQTKVGAIIPNVRTAGTITRRAIEATWMTASNPKKNLIGSELKAQIQCPPGYTFVGADVDSQELWISSIIGDSDTKIQGGTPFGWMNLKGKKSDGTDLHSKTAEILGINRNDAKVFNYGRIYGAGAAFAKTLLMQFNKTLTEEEAKGKADELFKQTKGQRKLAYFVGTENFRSKVRAIGKARQMLPEGSPDMDDDTILKRFVSRYNEWTGGTESVVFTKLEKIAASSEPKTPTLGCSMNSTLLSRHDLNNQFLTTRINWVVQSSGVDYLHLLLTSMKWLLREHGLEDQARFSVSIHDEVRYLSDSTVKHPVTLALQISNLLTRSLFAAALGLADLPQSVAFFTAVDIDHVLRKEVNIDCVTPSNPNPIPFGVSMNIQDILKVTNGVLPSAPKGGDTNPGPPRKMPQLQNPDQQQKLKFKSKSN